MKLVTSIPIIKKGDTVVVHGAHRLRVRDQFLVLICGRGNLANRYTAFLWLDSIHRHYIAYCWLNRTVHKENEGLFPKSAREDGQDFIQHLALENNYSVGLMFSLHELCKTICDKLTGILPRENVTR